MKTITRKTMLYQTGVEYGDYTMNHVQGCAHGCKFPCYAFLMKKRFGQIKDYEEWLEPCLVSNTLELLDREIPRLRDKIQSVQLCFTTDPFMNGYPEVGAMSIAAIRKLNNAGIRCTTLTKGILPLELAQLSPENEHGITLISLDESYREKMEPGASPYADRLAALRALHDAGCRTWVSIEPYPTPNLIEQDLQNILDAVNFVDKIIFGRTNYCKEVNAYKQHKAFYNRLAAQVTEFCEQHGIQYHIKEKPLQKDEVKAMALLQDLIQQIDDPVLRERIMQETDKLVKQKKFGLVFEEHLPECTPLYDVPIRVGCKVALKTGYVSDIYTVLKIDGDTVLCDRRETHEQKTFQMSDIVAVAEFGEPIYPTLKPLDFVENAPGSDLWHTLIEADNYHALQLLEYLYAEKVDCIYIDPPYNTGAKDWKYNNDYVDSSDAYRHSKWLS